MKLFEVWLETDYYFDSLVPGEELTPQNQSVEVGIFDSIELLEAFIKDFQSYLDENPGYPLYPRDYNGKEHFHDITNRVEWCTITTNVPIACPKEVIDKARARQLEGAKRGKLNADI